MLLYPLPLAMFRFTCGALGSKPEPKKTMAITAATIMIPITTILFVTSPPSFCIAPPGRERLTPIRLQSVFTVCRTVFVALGQVALLKTIGMLKLEVAEFSYGTELRAKLARSRSRILVRVRTLG